MALSVMNRIQWTERNLVKLLKPETNKNYNIAVTRAIIAIYNNQTKEEQIKSGTIKANKIGFSASDAKIGSYMAKYAIESNKPISGKFLAIAQKLSIKYRKQLTNIANSK